MLKIVITQCWIDDLSNVDVTLFFEYGVEDWLKLELDQYKVHTLDNTIVMAATLTDYTSTLKETIHDTSEGEYEKSKEKLMNYTPSPRQEKYKSRHSKPSTPCFVCGENLLDPKFV